MPNYSPECLTVWNLSAKICQTSGSPQIKPEHVIHAFATTEARRIGSAEPEKDELLSLNVFKAIDWHKYRIEKSARTKTDLPQKFVAHRSDATKAIFESAKHLSKLAGAGQVRLTDLFSSLVLHLHERRKLFLVGGSDPHDATVALFESLYPGNDLVVGRAKAPADTFSFDLGESDISGFGTDISASCSKSADNLIIGRREELLAIIRTLSRKTKNNVVLIGEPGVGKTSLVHELARRLARGKDTLSFQNPQVIEISVSRLLDGSGIRGELEQRLQSILDVAASHDNVIFFFDEAHLLSNVGAGDSGADLINVFKPALSQGQLKCIAATTPKEFTASLEKDKALLRRFEIVRVEEPDIESTRVILEHVRTTLESYHDVRFDEGAIDAALTLCDSYLTNSFFPDKAIDVLDTAASAARHPQLSLQHAGQTQATPVITAKGIADIVSSKTGIPVYLLAQKSEGNVDFERVERDIKRHIKGQDEPIEKCVSQVEVSVSGIYEKRGPISTFLFAGPTGVGKTETAKQFARAFFQSDSSFHRIDLGEFTEEHSVAKLIGAPPGYSGSEADGRLQAILKSSPHALILLDEVEKAHPRILDVFLHLFDTGFMRDNTYAKLDARSCIFVMTTNLDPESIHSYQFFRKEFLARVDSVIQFDHLGDSALREIIMSEFDKVRSRINQLHGKDVNVDPRTVDELLAEVTSDGNGARSVHSVFKAKVLPILIEALKPARRNDLVIKI